MPKEVLAQPGRAQGGGTGGGGGGGACYTGYVYKEVLTESVYIVVLSAEQVPYSDLKFLTGFS